MFTYTGKVPFSRARFRISTRATHFQVDVQPQHGGARLHACRPVLCGLVNTDLIALILLGCIIGSLLRQVPSSHPQDAQEEEFFETLKSIAGPKLSSLPGLLSWRLAPVGKGSAVVTACYDNNLAAEALAETMRDVWHVLKPFFTQPVVRTVGQTLWAHIPEATLEASFLSFAKMVHPPGVEARQRVLEAIEENRFKIATIPGLLRFRVIGMADDTLECVIAYVNDRAAKAAKWTMNGLSPPPIYQNWQQYGCVLNPQSRLRMHRQHQPLDEGDVLECWWGFVFLVLPPFVPEAPFLRAADRSSPTKKGEPPRGAPRAPGFHLFGETLALAWDNRGKPGF